MPDVYGANVQVSLGNVATSGTMVRVTFRYPSPWEEYDYD